MIDTWNHIAASATGASTSETSTANRVWRASFDRAMAHAASRNPAATTAARMRWVVFDWKLLATRGALARMTAMVAGDSHGSAMAYAYTPSVPVQSRVGTILRPPGSPENR